MEQRKRLGLSIYVRTPFVFRLWYRLDVSNYGVWIYVLDRTSFQSSSIRSLFESLHWNCSSRSKDFKLIFCQILDCQYAALLNTQSFISKAETINAVLPCADAFWDATSAQTWKMILGPSEMPPSTYYLTTLNTILLNNTVPDVLPFPALDQFSRILYAYVLHTHVFEWRQTLCMLNPNGLMRSVLSFAPQHIGAGLIDRRDWLLSALDNWHTNYSSHDAGPNVQMTFSPCGDLLYYLAQLAMRVSFSDLHLVTGRSGSEEDISLAEESLENWLQRDENEPTVGLAIKMLELAYRTIEEGQAHSCPLEIAVCLFIGGLICWTRCRLQSQPGTDDVDAHQMADLNDTSGASNINSELLHHVRRAAEALRSLWQCRLSAFFGSVLKFFWEDITQNSTATPNLSVS